MKRRTFLAAGVVGCVTLAGCSGESTDGDDGGADGDDGGADGGDGGDSGAAAATATPTEGPQTLDTHPVAQNLAAQPVRGPSPSEATGVIVAFEDPSCPNCASFETNVLPTLQEDLIEPGDVSMVYRNYPVIYNWGEPAVRALEATYDRDTATFWDLAGHYFEMQDEFRSAGVDQVYPRTETFLADSTDLDAAAVVSEAESGAYDDAVQSDLEAGQTGGAGRTTPHFFLFRDGTYQTKIGGLVSASIIKNTLDL